MSGISNDPGQQTRVLNEADARAIIRLLGDVAVLKADHRAKKRFVMMGMAKIINADVWMWGQTRAANDRYEGTPAPYLLIDDGWSDDEKRSLYFQNHGHPQYEELFNAPMRAYAKQATYFTVSRRQFISDDRWYPSDLYNRFRRPAGVDDFVYSIHLLGDGKISNMAFYRTCDAQPFSDRDRFLLHLVSSEVRWLHEAGKDTPAADYVAGLPQRLAQVLIFLLSGDSKKQIAAKLHVSYHTVDDYIKRIHRRFEVSSRGELLAKFLSGNIPIDDSVDPVTIN